VQVFRWWLKPSILTGLESLKNIPAETVEKVYDDQPVDGDHGPFDQVVMSVEAGFGKTDTSNILQKRCLNVKEKHYTIIERLSQFDNFFGLCCVSRYHMDKIDSGRLLFK